MTLIPITAFISFLGMAVFSALTSNLIGYVYVCPKGERIRLAYLNFWGVRRHHDLSVKDLVLPARNPSFYLPVKSKLRPETFRLLHNRGEILDYFAFSSIFEK